jgi:hypothetical protein
MIHTMGLASWKKPTPVQRACTIAVHSSAAAKRTKSRKWRRLEERPKANTILNKGDQKGFAKPLRHALRGHSLPVQSHPGV